MSPADQAADTLTLNHRGAKSLLLTMLGEFVFPEEPSVWTSTIIEGLGTLGITERNARQAVARLGEQGIVAPQRHGRRTRWHLTEAGTKLLATGTERIYSFGPHDNDWNGTWLLVMCPIPETNRAVRHRFRTLLTFEGFGFLSPSIAISPHTERERAANDIVAGLGLADSAMTFVAHSGAITSDTEILATAWDIDDLARRYRSFVNAFDTGPVSPNDPAAAFGATLDLVDAWRRFPFVDPELPADLLPTEWAGRRAHQVFRDRLDQLHEAATDWYLERETPGRPERTTRPGRAASDRARLSVTFESADPTSADSIDALGAYFAELDRRFEHGFDPGDALDADAPSMRPPRGEFVIARDVDGRLIGCGAVIGIDDQTAEIKRMWVRSDRRGLGLGRRLLTELERRAVAMGRTRVVLDTNAVLTEAIAMYERAGYRATERYNDNPYAMHWFVRDLAER